MSQTPKRITTQDSLLLVVDLQDRLLPAIHEAQACVAAARRMIEVARLLDLPTILTEQYPVGLGRTTALLLEVLEGVTAVEKTRFSACVAPVVERLQQLARPNVIVVGIEAHVCVQQTVLDLLGLGYTPLLCADAVGSRCPLDRDMAIQRMRQAEAIVSTTESVIFELLGQAGTEVFKQALKIVK